MASPTWWRCTSILVPVILVSRVGSGGPLSSFVFHPVVKDFEATGGLPNANCEGSYDAWHDVLRFLAKVKAR